MIFATVVPHDMQALWAVMARCLLPNKQERAGRDGTAKSRGRGQPAAQRPIVRRRL